MTTRSTPPPAPPAERGLALSSRSPRKARVAEMHSALPAAEYGGVETLHSPLCILHSALRTRKVSTIVYLAAFVLFAACSQPEIQPLSFNSAPWRVGESSTYQITAQDGASGTAHFAILPGNAPTNAGGWSMQREIEAQGVQERLTVELDKADLSPHASTLTRTSSQGQETEKALYNNGAVDIELTSAMSVTTNHHIDVPSDIRLDPTLAQLVRALPLASGYATRLNSFVPASGHLDRITVQVVKAEEITVPAGTFTTWQVELDTGDSKTRVWIGHAAPNPLVKFVDGRTEGTFVLAEYKPGQ